MARWGMTRLVMAALPALALQAAAAAAWLDCALAPLPGDQAARILLMTLGSRVERAVVVPLGMGGADAAGLKLDGARLTGQLVIGHEMFGNSKSVPRLASRMPLQLDLAIEGQQVKGTFAGKWPKGGRDPLAPADVKGQVTGGWRDEQRLKADYALPDSAAWPREGINLYDHKCSLTNSTGVVAEGKVFVLGALGIVRCVDAASGKVLWRAEVPGYSDFMKKFKADALAKRNVAAPTRSFCHGLNASGGTVVAPDGIGACGLVGLDATSGKVLWRVPRVLGKCATPLAWSKDGRHYVLAANEGGIVACIEAASGQVAWQFDGAGDNEYSVILAGDLLVGHKLQREERKKVASFDDPGGIHSAPGDNYGQVACWRLTPKGPELAWEAPTEWGAPSNCPIGAASGDLLCFRGKYSYYLVKAATGERIASSHLPTEVRWDEGHLLALPGLFVLHPDSQHGHTKMFPFPAKAGARVGPMWSPPHPHATTYQAAMSHAWADGRLFLRGADALYCYDLRAQQPAAAAER